MGSRSVADAHGHCCMVCIKLRIVIDTMLYEQFIFCFALIILYPAQPTDNALMGEPILLFGTDSWILASFS